MPIGAADRGTSFHESEITLGRSEWAVGATFTLPDGKGPFPAVVLVSGSGPGYRDLPVGGSRIFRDLAQGLGERGIAVIRYDKRTTTHSAHFEALHRRATIEEEFVADATHAAEYLLSRPEIDPGQIFIVGHSQGAGLAPRIANGVCARGAVLIAGSPRPPAALIKQQAQYMLSLAGTNAAAAAQAREVTEEASKLANSGEHAPDEIVLGAPVWYWKSVEATRPLEAIDALLRRDGRVLITQGARDYLVTDEDWDAWESALKGHAKVTLRRYPTLNHLLQSGTGKMTPAEYRWTRPVDTQFISDLAQWIKTGR